ncbi:AzlC family ABC transporter permease [Floccifex sp.]|uniref:AzlC family ABC transporter permease n=1 Tax=Floccifex sp. TaxID=2815810 RepID=UPI003F0556F1
MSEFRRGMKDGIPIGMGYFAVAFTLGIMAKNIGLTPIQGFITSALINASAGEYACFMMIASNGTFWQMVMMTIVSNARYFLMSFSLSQKLDEKLSTAHRMLIGFDVTDELFGLAINQKGKVNPYFMYGAYCVAIPGWALGTALGIVAGNALPVRIVSALSVALYGMFLAVIIPAAKKDKVVAILVIISFLLSYLCKDLPFSDGTKTIILTVVIAGIAAIVAPRKDLDDE